MEKERVYLPDNALQKGYFRILREILRELRENRWLISQLFKRDILSLYKQSFLGFMWAFIFPLVSVGTFIVLNRSGIFNIGDSRIPYPVFAITGMAFWQLFAMGIIGASASLVKAGSMIIKINFSKKSLVIASLGQSLIAFLAQILLVAVLFGLYRYTPDWKIVLIPLFALPIIMLTLGLGFLLSILNGIVRDIGNVISIFITFFMFLTPVLYPLPSSGILKDLSRFNPLYYLTSFPRDLILRGESELFSGYWISVLTSIFVLLFCIFIFHLTESRVTERV